LYEYLIYLYCKNAMNVHKWSKQASMIY
jgi:hypothetical protein